MLATIAAPVESSDVTWDDIDEVDPIGLEVGYRLVPLVDVQQNGLLLGRIRGVRKKLSRDLGFLVPPGEAVVWRGPMLDHAVTNFLRDTAWGELDFLIVVFIFNFFSMFYGSKKIVVAS